MISRAEYQRRHQEQAAAPLEADLGPRIGHHFFLALLTVLATLTLLITILINGTVLNESFAKQELTNSSLATSLQNTINQSVSQYGYSGTVVTTKQANQLIEQVVEEVYEDKTIQVDLSSIESSLTNQASEQLASTLGISVSLANNSAIAAIENQLNSQLNTSQLQEAASAIKTCKVITNLVLLVSLVVLALCLVTATFMRTVSFPITIGDAMAWVSLLFSGLLLLPQLWSGAITDDQTLAPLVSQVETDVMNKGWSLVVIPVAIFLLCLLVRVWRRFSRRA
ncbi:hypothetical protein ACLOCA_05730 [Limosilactobacillus fermentum]|uniref:hypothetical protein n=1 Tax=Limosilactobacillus fermentum TaxID=1613 RepID=UPI0022E315C7|nr:hypothetical protein [Limosilactobacillus fermentum]